MDERHIVVGSRRSDLALWQTNHVIHLLKQAYPQLTAEVKIISTKGDEVLDKALPAIGGKGLFTEALENALRAGDIDIAVHSLKDLPTEDAPALTVGAIPERAPVQDVLVTRGEHTLETLPQAATVGTSSRRRAAQLLERRPDLNIIDIRGNVPTRIAKTEAADGPYDATVLAQAGVERLELTEHISEILSLDVMLPAPGQGALGIQCRDEAQSRDLLAAIHHHPTWWTVTAERAFLNALGGGCSVPVAAFAVLDGTRLFLEARVAAVDGTHTIALDGETTVESVEDADKLGRDLATVALERGADKILEAVR